MMKLILSILTISSIIYFVSCTEKEPEPTIETFFPTIDSIKATNYEIMVGQFPESTELTAYAAGGNLVYIWEVDLGDIIPKSADGSVVTFTGAACCIGPKEIYCTVSNDKGSVKDTVIVNLIR